jgi:hypothetical protein
VLRITYTGGDKPQKWFFDPDEVDVLEAEKIEQALGVGATWDTFLVGLVTPSVRLRRVLLWHLLRRSNPGYDMPFSDTPLFKMGQFVVELGTKQIDGFITQIRDNPNFSTAQRDRLISGFEEARAEAALAEATEELGPVDTDPKAPAPPGPGTPREDNAPEPLLPAEPIASSEADTSPSSPTT